MSFGVHQEYCLSALLSAASGLTSLNITVEGGFGLSQPLYLPQLSSLTAVSGCQQLAAAVLRKLTAPLTSVHLSYKGKSLELVYDQYAGGRLAAKLASLTQLTSLSLVTPPSCNLLAANPAPSDLHAQQMFQSMRHLQKLDLCAKIPVLQTALQLLAQNRSPVTRLCIAVPFECDRRFPYAHDRVDYLSHWLNVVRILPCFQLQHLVVNMRECEVKQERYSSLKFYHPNANLASIKALVQLTTLVVDSWCCIGDRTDYQTLAGMSRLRHLHLDACSEGLGRQMDGIWKAFAALSVVTHVLIDDKCTWLHDHVQKLIDPERDRCGVLPELRQLTLPVPPNLSKAEALIRAAARLPSLDALQMRFKSAFRHPRTWPGSDEQIPFDQRTGYQLPPSLLWLAEGLGLDISCSEG